MIFGKIHPKHILVCRNDALGDTILALPLCGLLKKHIPDIKISFLGRGYTQPIVAMSQNIDAFVNFDEICKLTDTQLQMFFSGLQIDTAIHLRADKGLAELIQKTGIKNRIGTFHSIHHLSTCNKWVNFSRSRSHLNESQLDIKMLSALGIKEVPSLDELPQYYGLHNIPKLSSELQSNLIDPNKFNLVLHPLTTGNGPEWGLDNFSQLLNILDPTIFNIIIGGSKQDLEKMSDFLQKNQGKYHHDSGALSLEKYIALINASDGLVAGSTGPAHISAALGKYTLGLYTDVVTKNVQRWGPVGKHVFTLEGKDNDMNTILPVTVQNILMNWLNK
ncbi:glycosyltransferase family 9 protein [Rhizosphaericola mali]|uniref:Glycosyltransferase family 9 protein n=1 Tax=Rhizosphaericola mali TaxID=2545455 RepID=A0A5P2G5M9_9BACT|nr:glycosyltransferase family 9 protein [Rhizosphaericola mali]QES90527.1 glycosyltransferase family 9 protein [Rhizosphaericola mali]